MNNEVELTGYYGSDMTHALSAWTSTKRDLTREKEERIGSLLRYLATRGHHTPFEKSMLHFLVDVETASHIHLLKHRIGVSINAESARYKELKEDKYYIPTDWPDTMVDEYKAWIEGCFTKYHLALKKLEEQGMDRKRAKESARFYLPYANQLTLDVSFNFRSFMHFQGLRNEPDAQAEIRHIAQQMLSLVFQTGVFNHSLAGFGYELGPMEVR